MNAKMFDLSKREILTIVGTLIIVCALTVGDGVCHSEVRAR